MAYIDDVNLIEEIKSLRISVGGKDIFFDEAKESILRIIKEQPTADVAEVVRCKDCKFCKKIKYDSGKTTYHCKFCMSQSIPDDMVDDSLFDIGEFFCGLGKRSEEYDGKIY